LDTAIPAHSRHTPSRSACRSSSCAALRTSGLFKNEAVAAGSPFRTGPLRTLADVEALTMSYIDWYNDHRLHSLLELAMPEEFERAHYAHKTGSPSGEATNTKTA
jgi:hypothetical protein